MATRNNPLFSGDTPPGNEAGWTESKFGGGTFQITETPDGYFTGYLEDDHSGDSGDAEGPTRVTYTIPANNTVNPILDMAFSVAFSGSDCEIGLVIEGSTGHVSCNVHVDAVGNATFAQIRLHTGIDDRGAAQSPAGSPQLNSGLLWLRLSYDTTTSDKTVMSISNNGENFLQGGGNEFLDIGTIQRVGFNFAVDNDTAGDTRELFRIYHFDAS